MISIFQYFIYLDDIYNHLLNIIFIYISNKLRLAKLKYLCIYVQK